jgi:F420-non-reducing hydrogenase iron-sulfur subunit
VAFEPKIIAFLCNWCAYAGADLAGTSRTQYPPNTRTIRIMCTGRMSPVFILKYGAEKRVNLVSDLLPELGIEKERLMLRWISASEGELFGKTVSEFTDTIKNLGPSPLRKK